MEEMKEGESDSLGLVARLHFFTWWSMKNSPCSIRVQFSFPTTLCSIRKECPSVSIILTAIKKLNYFILMIYLEFL